MELSNEFKFIDNEEKTRIRKQIVVFKTAVDVGKKEFNYTPPHIDSVKADKMRRRRGRRRNDQSEKQ